ncbi:MAG: tRNA (N6-threonylcarbamoyladenosine(37)-N6)-methyltransferase TrmO [Desulfurococcaceae archaeon]
MEIVLRPIGYVRTCASDDEVRSAWPDGVEGYVEVLPEYSEGLAGLEGHSHVILIAYLHKRRGREGAPLRVRPRRLARLGLKLDELPEVGVFATDSPDRPNPIALSIVRLLGIEGNRLRVADLDLFDGTPVLDIKPYDSSRVIRDFAVPEWKRELEELVGCPP